MARPMNSAKQTAGGEPTCDVDPVSGATIEVFYADQASASCFGVSSAGWLWWCSKGRCLPDASPVGPFATSYAAYRDALGGSAIQFGSRIIPLLAPAPMRQRATCFHIASTPVGRGSN